MLPATLTGSSAASSKRILLRGLQLVAVSAETYHVRLHHLHKLGEISVAHGEWRGYKRLQLRMRWKYEYGCLLDMTQCSLVDTDRYFIRSYCLHRHGRHRPDDGGSKHLWNVYLFIHSLFNVAFFIKGEKWIMNWKGLGSGCGLILSYYPGIFLVWLRKITTNLAQNSLSLWPRLKLDLPNTKQECSEMSVNIFHVTQHPRRHHLHGSPRSHSPGG